MRLAAGLAVCLAVATASPGIGAPLPFVATAPGAEFQAIEGGALSLSDWAGQPVLVVNTASRCGFTRQYDDLQALYDRFRDRGLVVLAVPSNDFRQELASATEVAEFCAVNFDLDLPMTDITPVKGAGAHPFYRWLADSHGFTPGWNFNKVLIDGQGNLVATWGSAVRPTAGAIIDRIEPLLR